MYKTSFAQYSIESYSGLEDRKKEKEIIEACIAMVVFLGNINFAERGAQKKEQNIPIFSVPGTRS